MFNFYFNSISIFKSKIVYLFETDTIVANLDGRYLIFENILFLFSQAPEFIFECSNSMFDKNDRKIDDQKTSFQRTFMYYSPMIQSIEVIKKGRVRRAKLYYLKVVFLHTLELKLVH